MIKFAVAATLVVLANGFKNTEHEDLSKWKSVPKTETSLNFTQFVCKGSDALNNCEGDVSKCGSTTHEQGACLTAGGGAESLTVTCKQTPLGVDVDIVVYQGVTNCTGTPNPFTEKADFCYQSGGGKEFFKYECEQKSL
jgi:hypothetical protein